MMNVVWGLFALGVVLYFVLGQGGGENALSAQEANATIAETKDLQLVDVRTPEEYREGHLPQARNIPLDQLEKRLGELKADKPLLLYCHSGRRSSMAMGLMKKRGFTQMKNMKGGISAWNAAGLPVLK